MHHCTLNHVQMLLLRGAKVNAADSRGRTALAYAMTLDTYATLECARVLLAAGAATRMPGTKAGANSKGVEILDPTGESWVHRAVRYGESWVHKSVRNGHSWVRHVVRNGQSWVHCTAMYSTAHLLVCLLFCMMDVLHWGVILRSTGYQSDATDLLALLALQLPQKMCGPEGEHSVIYHTNRSSLSE